MAMLFTFMLGISAGILGYLLYDFGRQDFLRETEAAIDAEINVLNALNIANTNEIDNYIGQRNIQDSAIFYRFESEDGKWKAGNIKKLPEDIKTLKEGILLFNLDHNGTSKQLAAKIKTFSDGSKIVVAREINILKASYQRLQYLSVLIMVLMLIVIFVSYGISYFVVSRINQIANTAQNIVNTGDLSKRISVDTTWDDLSNLAQTLNTFLEQIENLMLGIKEVSNNIAHDLRTPLTSLRNDIESLKEKSLNNEDIDKILLEADRLLAMFQSLLRIANIEKGAIASSFQVVDLARILNDVIELYDPLAEEAEINLLAEIENEIHIIGEANLLFQLFANIIDNAIKFSDKKSQINIRAISNNGRVLIVINDNGIGIPDNEKEAVFKHFYRTDKSRTKDGYGLGLSLAKAIVERHNGIILLKDSKPQGLEVHIEFNACESKKV